MTAKDTTVPDQARPAPKRIPRACSDVFRLWAALGLGILLSLAFFILQDLYQEMGLRKQLTPAQLALEEDYGSNLVGWVTFAVAYLWLGIRAFRGADHAGMRTIGPLRTPAPRQWRGSTDMPEV